MLPEQTENVLGALSLALSDRMHDAVCQASGQSSSGAAALSALLHFDVDLTVDLLAKVLGVSSSGAVRVVDRLAAAGLVRRREGRDGKDGRVTWIALTAAGRRAAGRVSEGRRAVLAHALRVLDEDQRSAFGDLIGRVLAGMVRPPGAVRWTCRLCDTAACHRPEGLCPAAEAAGYQPGPPDQPTVGDEPVPGDRGAPRRT